MDETWFEIRRTPKDARPSRIREVFERAGLRVSRAGIRAFGRLLEDSTFTAVADAVVAALRDAADPSMAIGAIEDVRHRLAEGGQSSGRLWSPDTVRVLVALTGASRWATRTILREPDSLFQLADQVQAGTLNREVRHDPSAWVRAAGENTARFDAFLRRTRNRHMLRICLQELWDTDVRRTSRALADLADACIHATFLHHRAHLLAQHGLTDSPCRAVVIGMGKLGGMELNFSSDVDLIYVYEHDDGVVGDLTHHQIFVKLFERITRSLNQVTEHGFVFRVDLDLRPEGKPGPLANSLAGLERYYETWGRTWERAAWIRARPVAGDLDLGREVLEVLRPFVFRRSMDLSQVEALVEMKAEIDRVQRRKARKGEIDLKLGRGGIREAEFFVQAHQLLYGGRQPELRVQGTLDALEALVAKGLVSAQTRNRLDAAYRWLRRVEHRIQLVDEQQTHRLPADPDSLAHLAHTFGLDPQGLTSEIGRHTTEVSALFEALLGRVDDDEPLPEALEVVLDPEATEPERMDAAHRLGAVRPDAALAAIDRCRRTPGTPMHPSPNPTGMRLLKDCFESPLPDRALASLPAFLSQLRRHGSYVAQLERPSLRRGVARLLGTSELLARILTSDPRLLRLVILQSNLPGPDQLPELLRESVDPDADTERKLVQLRKFKQQEILRTAVFDLAGALPLADVEARLTRLAECLLEACLDLACQDVKARYGEAPRDAALVLLASGALGAAEISYRTDVDLAAIYVGEGKTSGGSRGCITTTELWTRVVQRLVSFLTLPMEGGDLYPVDMRLRPSGNQGTLLTSLRGFASYHSGKARLWERQALVRTRALFGGPARSQVEQALQAAAYDGPPPNRDEIHAMRLRLVQEHEGSERPDTDLKFGPGGLVELQFMLQYLQLREGRTRPELRTPYARQALQALADAGVLEPQTVAKLIQSYDRLRREQNLMRLLQDSEVHRRHAARRAQQDEMPLQEARDRIRQAYEWVMGRR